MNPQVGDIVRVKDEHEAECGCHMGLVTERIRWPDERPLTDCTIFLDPNLVNPVQFQTRYIEVISRG
jgi:hypothetical protein